MYRADDYAAASIPILPVEKGAYITKVQMLLYVIAFVCSTVLLVPFGYTGYLYLAVALPLGLAWLYLSIKGFRATNDQIWAKKMFRLSLVVVMALSIMISVDTV